MTEMTIEVQPREERGKNSNRRLREQGLVPAVVYGGGRDPVPVQVNKKALLELMRSTEGHNPVFLLQLAGTGKSRHAMIREMQINHVTRHLLHVDFQRVVMTEKIRVAVHVELVGVPYGVKTEGGLLDFVSRELHITCTPDKIPAKVEVDVTGLHVGQHIEAGQIELPEGVELTDEPGRVIASVSHLRASETATGGEAGLLETESAQPEVIRRGKPVDE
jgi:large subunit ribosomal protein L25